jgi:hypothetical protein
MVRWAVHVARFREVMNSYIWVGKPKGKISVGRSKRGWDDNIKIDFKEVMYVLDSWSFGFHKRQHLFLTS